MDNNANQEFRFALEFDLSSIPSGSTIHSAVLELRTSRHDHAGQTAIYGYAGNGSIEMADMTAGSLVLSFIPTTLSAPREPHDVTSFVAARVGSGDPWAGFLLRQEPLGSTDAFWDCPENTIFPQLIVEYMPPTTPPDTVIDSGPPAVSASTLATFTFSGSDDVTAPGQLHLDGGRLQRPGGHDLCQCPGQDRRRPAERAGL